MTTRSVRRLAAVVIAATATAGWVAVPAQAADEGSVPVLGQALSRGTIDPQSPEAVITVHGVRRIQSGTVVYFSAGFPAGTKNATSLNLALALGDQFNKYAPTGRPEVRDQTTGMVAAIDQRGRKIYSPLLASGNRCVCSHGSVFEHVTNDAAGTAFVMYAVLPSLPATATKVDVSIGDKVMPDVPVQDGAMTPAVSPDKPIALGSGWPTVDEAALGTVAQPGTSIYTLTQQVTAGPLTTRTKTSTTSVDIASDVLFAKDSATLTAAADTTLKQAADALKADKVTGTVDVIGYTDSDASEAYNLDLSKRRAAAVVTALKPLVPTGITLVAQGKGEADPVASNDTDAGKTLNRRVSLSFQGGDR